MKTFSLTLGVCLLLSLGLRTQAAPKTNLLSPTSPVPIDTAGPKFELRLPTGKMSFQQGETIKVKLLFSSSGSQKLWLNTFSNPREGTPASFTAEPREGTVNPLRDLPDLEVFVYNGPPPPPPKVLGENPIQQTAILNETLRFDRPGIYQIRATTNQVFATAQGQPTPKDGSFFGNSLSVTSDPLTIQIVPANPTWQQEQVDAWRAFWAKQKPAEDGFGWKAPPGVSPPANALRFLNTRAAAQAIIDRLGQDIAPRSSGSEAYFWRSGLIGFTDRLWLISAMKDAIKRPNYPVTQGLLENLATLQGLYHVARPGAKTSLDQLTNAQERAYLANWQATLAALPPKTGRARAMTVHSLLETVWSSRPQNAHIMQPHMAHLLALVPDIFNDLPQLPQQILLGDKYGYKQWNFIKSSHMIPALLRAWKTVPPPQGWRTERANLILRHLYELDPKAARPLILQEMASPNPRVSFEVLSLLNDKSLPQLQNIWWEHMTSNGPAQDMAALLIGRYATPALKLKVQKEYTWRQRANLLSSDVQRGLKRYLKRVGAL